MKKYFLTVFVMGCTVVSFGQQASFVKKADGIIVYPADKNIKAVELKVVSNNIIKVLSSANNTIKPDTSFMILPANAINTFSVGDDAATVSVSTNTIKAVVAKSTGLVSFFTKEGKRITKESAKSLQPVQLEQYASNKIIQQFSSPADEALYGLGQHQEGIMNYKNTNLVLYQNNTEVFIPFLVSNKNYGILWDNYSITDFGDGRTFNDINSIKLFDKNGAAGSLSAVYLSKTDAAKIFTTQKENTIDYADLDMIKNIPAAFKLEDGKTIWEGFVQGNITGDYTFKIWSGGYFKFWANGKLLTDRWRQCWNPFTAYVTVPLSKDKKTAVKIEWIPDGGESFMSVKVMEPMTAQQKKIYQFQSEAGDNINYYFVYGKTYDEIISGYRRLTGKTPVVPKWVLGFWQSRERYKSQDDILTTVKTFREKKIPLDNIVQDWQYWKINEWGSQQFDPARYSNPDSMIEVLHNQYHTKFMISVWAKFYTGIPNFDLMQRQGFLLNKNVEDGRKDWLGYVNTSYDVHNPAARKQFWQLLKTNLYSKKIDAWWMDASEPDIHSNMSIAKRKDIFYPNAMGSAIKYFNSYPLLNSQAIYEGQRATNDNKRVFILTRSGYAGIQRYGSAIWSGDIGSTWADMKNQVSAGINFSISGVPYWTFDAGGFAVENRYVQGKDLDEWKELQARWYEFGSFLPLFRAHGQAPLREPFNIAKENEDTYKAIVGSIERRYTLLPTLYSIAADVHFKNGTFLKGMMMEFPNDKKVENINDQLMCGPSILVNPIYNYKERSRKVYLPAGTNWYGLYDNKIFKGGQTIDAPAPINTIPVFVKEGSILVTGPVMQYSTEKPADTLTVTIYGNKDAFFSLYEDENENYNYEQGKFSKINLTYAAQIKTFTIDGTGEFEGMLKKRVFNVVFIDNTATVNKQLNYSGNKVAIKF
ncbi:TIM-barrel domain-containing protein [Ferruginibacter sp. SUN106]|uniref:TIM-barrel domain-containing protein n=1 Tax=Ferruginibacter sp. SUN106 TaxID=2978348 RepID=UPI003D36F9E8